MPTVPAFKAQQFTKLLQKWESPSKNVLIIGAGVSGLYAAYTLQALGFENYQILEASNKIGGRLSHKEDFVDLPLDEGAEWIHYVPPRVLQDLLLVDGEKVDVETIKYSPETWSTYTNEKRHNRNFMKYLYGEYKFATTTWYSYVEKYIAARLKSDAIALNTVVESIDSSNPEEIHVTTKDGRVFKASNVIVTASAGVLQSNVIQFVPEMPEKWRTELKKIDFADGYKAWFQFKENFYPDIQVAGSMFDIGPTKGLLYFDSVFGKPTDANVLGTLQLGSYVSERCKLSDEKLEEVLINELDEIFDGKASENLIKSAIKNWSAEPFIRGTYSVSASHDIKTLRKGSGDKRVLFAGEHLGEPQGIVQGAALSGRRAVEMMLS